MSEPESDPELGAHLREALPPVSPPPDLTAGVWRRLALRADRRWYQELFPSWHPRWVVAAVVSALATGGIVGGWTGHRATLASSEARYLSAIDPAYRPH